MILDPILARLIYNEDKDWRLAFASALADPATFHLCLIASAIHLNFTTKDYNRSEFIFHKMRVIQLLNQSINHCSQVTNGLMLTVANLALMEVGTLTRAVIF